MDDITQSLLKFKTNVDNDNIRFKEIIKEKLVNNEAITRVLNNKELQEADADPSDYFNVNILPYFIIHPVQHNVENYICYEVSFDEVARYNSIIKQGQIIFYILCEERNNIEETTGIARHDLLAALITEDFNWTNLFGAQIHLVSDKPSTTDKDYATRTLIFEGKFPNSIAKTQNDKTRVVNNFGNNR